MNTEVWSMCESCGDDITGIEKSRFDGKCQACYLGISKQTAKHGTTYYTLMSAIQTKPDEVEVNIAFPEIGVVEVIIGRTQGGLGVVKISYCPDSIKAEHVASVVDDVIENCIDFEEVAETLRMNSIG